MNLHWLVNQIMWRRARTSIRCCYQEHTSWKVVVKWLSPPSESTHKLVSYLRSSALPSMSRNKRSRRWKRVSVLGRVSPPSGFFPFKDFSPYYFLLTTNRFTIISISNECKDLSSLLNLQWRLICKFRLISNLNWNDWLSLISLLLFPPLYLTSLKFSC